MYIHLLFVTFIFAKIKYISRDICLASLVEGLAVEEICIGTHEVRVASHTGLTVQPGDDVLQESSDSRGVLGNSTTGGKGKLGKPELGEAIVRCSLHGLLNEGLKILGAFAVPVNSETGDLAVRALLDELTKPAQTLAIVGRGAHGGRNEFGLAIVRGDVCPVICGGVSGAHAGLPFDVRLVESKDVVGAAGEDGLDGGSPATKVLGSPEHGDELNAVGEVSGKGASPVVGP